MSLNQAREAWAHGRRVDEWGRRNNPPGGYSMEVAVVRPPFCFACAYSRNVWQAPRTGDALPGGKVDADIKKSLAPLFLSRGGFVGHAASRLLTHNAVVACFAVFGPFLFRDILHNKLRLASCINDRADVDSVTVV